MKASVRLVVFDIAGTTLKDNGGVALAFQQALEAFGYAVPLEKINPLMGYEKEEAIRRMLDEYEELKTVITPGYIHQIHQQFLNFMISYYQETTNLTALPGVEEVFDRLKERGINRALNTGFSKNITDVILQRLAWVPGKVDYVISSSEVPAGRPAPFMIQKLMQQAGLTDARQVIKVGDTEVDIREGRNAGCLYSVGVTTGAFTREALEPYQPDFIIDTLMELLPIIDKRP
jgi:phosphonatase-like hydrolase